MAHREEIQTLCISMLLLWIPVLASENALSSDLEAGAAADAVQLKYAWKPNVKIYVETRRGRIRRHFLPEAQSNGFSLRYLLSTIARDGNLHVTFSDLATGQDNPAGDENAFVEAVMQFAGLVPGFLVSPKGEFLRLENAAATSSQMKQYITSAVPSLEGSPGLAQALHLVSSEQFLQASAVKQWDGIVGFWVGERLEVGATYEAEGVAPHPMIPGMTIAMKATYSAARRVPCEPGSKISKCIELVSVLEVDGDQLKEIARRLADRSGDESEIKRVESFQITMMKEETRLITEPETLMPHYFEFRKTVEGRSGPNEEDRDGRIDYQESSFRYR